MKRVLSALMAGALTVAMAVPAFAADSVLAKIYDKDGKVNDDVYDSTVGWSFGSGVALGQSLNVDGVVPGAELYIPLAATSGASYQVAKTPDAAAIAAAKVAAVAAVEAKADATGNGTDTGIKTAGYKAMTPDTFAEKSDIAVAPDDDTTAMTTDYKYYKETQSELQTIFDKAYNASVGYTYNIPLKYLTDKDYFKFSSDKDDGSKYVSKIEVVDDKKLGSLDRTAYLKITLADSTTTSDLKSTGSVEFKAKKSSADAKVTDGVWAASDSFKINYTFWINNVKKSNDDNVDTGDRVYFDPTKNETNTLVWGDDRAAIYFEANDDASKFYARLQTKSDSSIYSTYGDPVNADLWFYDFVGNPTIPSTSRASLTLGIPWDEDDDYTPNPEDCFIYEKDADGNLVDVTSKFTYDADNDSTTGIEGWTIKTRTLGTYIISDTELDTTVADDVDEEPADDTSSTIGGGKEIPNTGSSDMVGVAVVAAVVSLAAAGAVAFKKASK